MDSGGLCTWQRGRSRDRKPWPQSSPAFLALRWPADDDTQMVRCWHFWPIVILIFWALEAVRKAACSEVRCFLKAWGVWSEVCLLPGSDGFARKTVRNSWGIWGARRSFLSDLDLPGCFCYFFEPSRIDTLLQRNHHHSLLCLLPNHLMHVVVVCSCHDITAPVCRVRLVHAVHVMTLRGSANIAWLRREG